MTTTKTDGRTARLERNRAEIVRAQVEHAQETGKLPTVDEIAERANVSQRSVFRIFGDKASLLREASEYVYRQLDERFPFPELAGLAMHERITRMVDHFASIYEFITPMRRVLATSEIDPEFVSEERERVSVRYQARIRDAFSDLDLLGDPSPVRLRTFRLIASWNAWEYLRTEGKLSVEDAKEVICQAITAVLQSATSTELPVAATALVDGDNEHRRGHSETQEGDWT
ncbi:MAG: TetR/AcrR family transcriptional regulator [Candidatus Bipolaricaulota bacterium]